jgi:hypothetical protein
MLNGVSDIRSGGNLTTCDYIQLQNGINQQADIGFDTNFNSDC